MSKKAQIEDKIILNLGMILSTYTKCVSDKPPTSAVLVFLVEKDTLRGPKLKTKGLTLERDKAMERGRQTLLH